MITADDIRAHLVHPVNKAPHMAVCACGEVFYSAPGVMTAFETWASHLADQLNLMLTGSAS